MEHDHRFYASQQPLGSVMFPWLWEMAQNLFIPGAILALSYGYWVLYSQYPAYVQYFQLTFLVFASLALLITFSGSIYRGKVKWMKWLTAWSQSWMAFVIGFLALACVYYLSYWVIITYTNPDNLAYFKWGVYISVAVSGFMLVFNEPLVILSTGAKRVRKREDCPELWDAVHKITPWHAHPVPRIYILPTSGMNAISFGWGIPFFSAVGATRGLVDRLDKEELEAVMAHEMGHVINKDILVSMTMGLCVMIIAVTGWIILRFGSNSSSGRRSSNDSGKGLAILFIVGLGLYVVGRGLGIILQMFVSRQREYAADATAARIIGTSEPLKSALLKISKSPSIGSENLGAAVGMLCSVDPEPDDVMATHPSIENRLRALDFLEK